MKKIILIIIILTGVLIFGQSSTTLNTNLINYPQAPETAKLLNFNEVELNNFSGQAKHTVPLFKIEEADFIQDFILSYSYAGLKIEEQNSIYGYSWNANFYGGITRSVRGLPDECNYGFFGAHVSSPKNSTV